MSSEAGSAGAAEHIGFFKDKAGRRFNYDEADRGSDSGDTASIHQLDVDFRIPQNTDAATVLAFIPELTERIATASLSEMKELQKYVLKAFEMNLNIEEAVAAEYATPEVVRAETASNLSNEDTTPVGSVQIARDTSGSRALYTIFEAPEAIVAAETLEKNVLWTLAEDTANFSAAEPTMMPPPPLPTGNISEATASMTRAHVALRNSIRLARNFFPTTSDSSSPRRIPHRRRRRRSPNDFRMLWQRIFADIGELSANCGSIDAISYQPLSRLPDDLNPSRVRYVPAAEGVSSWQLPRQPIGASSSLSQVLPIEMGMSAPTMQNNEPISVYESKINLHVATLLAAGVKAVDKRDGAGAHNWGSVKETIDDVNKNENEAAATTGEKADDSGNEQAEQVPVEEETKELTLDEWKAQKGQRAKPTYNIRKAGEGEDTSQWKKMIVLNNNKKKENESEEELEFDPAMYPQRVGRQQRVLDIQFNFNDGRRGGGGFGGRGRGGRGARPGGPGAGAPTGAPGAAVAGVAPNPERPRFDGGARTGGMTARGGKRNFAGSDRQQNAAPKVNDERQFPTLA